MLQADWETDRVGRQPSVDDVFQRWNELRQRQGSPTVEDLCAECPDKTGELKDRLRAIASMMSLLGLEPEAGLIGSPWNEREGPAGSSAMIPEASSPLGRDIYETVKLVRIPGYEVLEELGRGGMGVVYKARQHGLDRFVALKMILSASQASPAEAARFMHEAKTIALLKHPNVVQVHEFGSQDGKPFFSLEYLEGGSLAEKLRGEPQAPLLAAQTVHLLAQAVQAAHEHGIVHRDLKPANVLLAADGTPKISDFGIAKQRDSVITATGEVLGTPSYMAPEQAGGKAKNVGPAADIYALGAILYEMLTGRPPFKGASAWETIQFVTNSDPVTPRQLQPMVPRDLETICLKCLEKEPAKRYPMAADLASDLSRFQAGETIQARPVGSWERAGRWCLRNKAVSASLVAGALSLLAAAVVSALFWLRAESARQAQAEEALSETLAKQDAVAARSSFHRQLIDATTQSGLLAARDGDQALALLWFARTAALASDLPERETLSRIRYANWLRSVWTPEGALALPGFRRDQDHFREFSFSPDGRYLLVRASAGDLLIWDRPNHRQVQLPGFAKRGSAAAWEPKSGLLAVGDQDGKTSLLAPPDFTPVEEVRAEGDVAVLAFSADGHRLAWGGAKGARVWDREQNAYCTPLLLHGGLVATLAFSADGALLATSAQDLKARVFRVASATTDPLFPPVPHVPAAYGISHGGPESLAPRFAAGDRILLTVEKRVPHVFDIQWRSAATGEILKTSKPPPGHDLVGAFKVSPDGNRVAVSRDAGWVRMLDARTQEVVAGIGNGGSRVDWCEDFAFSPDGTVVVTCDLNMKVETWSVDDQQNLELARAVPPVLHPHSAVRVELSRDGRHMAVALWDGTVCLWRAPEDPPLAYQFNAGGPTWLALSQDRKLALPRGASYRNGSLRETRVHDAATGEPVGAKLTPGGIIVDAEFRPGGTQVVVAALTAQTPEERNSRMFLADGKAGNVQVWDWKTGRRLIGPVPMPAEPRGLALGPDGRALAVVCADYRVVLVDAATGAIRHDLDPGIRSRPLTANLWTTNGEALFSPDGRYLLTWELKPTLHIWNPENGQLLHMLEHTERVESAVFNPAAPHVLATSGRDSVVKVWDLTTGELVVNLPHPRWVPKIMFSPDGTELISACYDGLIRSWNWRTGQWRSVPHVFPATSFDLTADRRWLVALGLSTFQATEWQSGAPIGPVWRFPERLLWGVEIPAGDRRAIVGGHSGTVLGFDLAKIVTPTMSTPEDLTRLAEVSAGRRIVNEGNVVPLNTAEWTERWKRLQKSPQDR
jgi:WD40 repeat protein/tRNA A-37 threonylcarbamoyl transferase component Bud32